MQRLPHSPQEREVFAQDEEQARRHLVFASALAAATSLVIAMLMIALHVHWLAGVTGAAGIAFAMVSAVARQRLFTEANRTVLWVITIGAIAVSALGAGRVANIQYFLMPAVPALCLIHPCSRRRAGIIGALSTAAVLCGLEVYWLIASPVPLYTPAPPAWYGSLTPMLSLVLLLLVTYYHRTLATDLLNSLIGARQDTEQAAGAQKRFVDQAAHDLRTPLHAIAGFAEKLRRGQDAAPKALDEIERATKLVGVMIDEIIAYTAGASPVATVSAKPINLSRLLREVSELLSGAGLDLVIKLPEADAWVLAESTRTWHVIVTIVTEATANRQTPAPVKVKVEATDDFFDVLVLRPEDSAPLAESIPLQRSGEWLRNMNGSLDVTPDSYRLRFARSNDVAHTSIAPDLSTQSQGTILAVDDNPVNLVLLSACLTELGIPYETATNGLLAVERWRQGGIALIFMDYSMPTLDGAQATTHIRAIENERGQTRVPIIGVTANTEDSGLCLTAGMDEVVAKPFGIHKLKSTLARWNVSTAKQLVDDPAP